MKTYTKMELIIRQWVRDNYGESEVVNPSWDIGELASYLEKNLGLDLESQKKLIKSCFMDNLKSFQRVNRVLEMCKSMIYDKDGGFMDNGHTLRDYVLLLDKKAKEIEEREPDYSELDDVK